MAKLLLENVKNGNSVLLEIKPKYYSTWDYSRNNWTANPLDVYSM